MKKLLVALVITNILTIVGAVTYVNRSLDAEHDRFSVRVRELDKFYYGFCKDVQGSGLGFGKNYERLCG